MRIIHPYTHSLPHSLIHSLTDSNVIKYRRMYFSYFLYIKNLSTLQTEPREGVGEETSLPSPLATADGSRPSAQPVLP